VSSFDHVTSPPTSTVTIYGRKHSFVSSHPGTDVPCGVLTITGSANAGLDTIPTTIANNTKKELIAKVFIKMNTIWHT
jgi:hypothetical protein